MVCVLGRGLCRNDNFPGQAILSKISVDSCLLIFHAVDEMRTKAASEPYPRPVHSCATALRGPMKAAVFDRYGPPDVMHVAELPKPVPTANQLLIRVRGAEVTKGDCELRSMDFPVRWFLPLIRLVWGWRKPRRRVLGGYFSGTVAAVGAEVTRLSVGDDVFGTCGTAMGAHAEFMVVSADETVVHKPVGLSFEEAAAVPLGAMNSLHFLRLGKLRAGERLLINGAGGSIGSFAVQLAKSLDAHVTVVDAPHKEALLLGLGADRFVDYTAVDLGSHEARYDMVFDMVAASDFAVMRRLLVPDGRYLTGNPTLKRMWQCLTLSRFSSQQGYFAFARETRQELLDLAAMADAGQLRVVLDRVLPLAQAAAAHARVGSEARVGLVVLVPVSAADSVATGH